MFVKEHADFTNTKNESVCSFDSFLIYIIYIYISHGSFSDRPDRYVSLYRDIFVILLTFFFFFFSIVDLGVGFAAVFQSRRELPQHDQ